MEFLRIRDGEAVLFVGEGNFSFSEALVRRRTECLNCRFVSTCFESAPVSDLAASNADSLRRAGAEVMYNVDATRLRQHFERGDKFDLVVFMFPHVGGKMKIQLNRDLLRSFAASSREVLTLPGGKVAVALCGGQGGTEYDTVQRREADTWQVTRMMAYAGLQAVRIEQLRADDLGMGYQSHGYRSLPKGFHTEKAVGHMFELGGDAAEELQRRPFVQHKMSCLTNKSTIVGKELENLLQDLKKHLPQLTVLTPTHEHSQTFAEQLRQGTCEGVKGSCPLAKVILTTDFSCPDFSKSPFQLFLAIWPSQHPEWQRAVRKNCLEVLEESPDFVLLSLCSLPGIKNLCEKDWRQLWIAKANLSPPIYTHDLSFWKPGDGARPSFSEVRSSLWCLGGDLVSSLELVDDAFRRASDGARSMTVRIGYRCLRFPLGPEVAWKLHLEHLGRGLAEEFGVQIR